MISSNSPETMPSTPAPSDSGSPSLFHRAWVLLKSTALQWQADEASRLAASLALYTLLSIAPLLIIAVAVAGMVIGDEAARGQISQELTAVVGPHAGEAIQNLVANARAPSASLASSLIGVLVLLYGASGVFAELQETLNKIWKVKPRPGMGLWVLLRERFFSFTMVMGVAFLLLVSLVVSTTLETFTTRLRGVVEVPALWEALNFAVGLAGTALLFTLIFKLVPDAKIAWRDVWLAGVFTSVAFSAGRTILSWYIANSATVSPFGAAGSLVALVIWVYYSAQILFLGAEFARAYATRHGDPIAPKPHAVNEASK